MKQPDIVDVYAAHESVDAGTALLVCAYEDDSKFQAVQLAGALSFRALTARLPSLSLDEAIILYCA